MGLSAGKDYTAKDIQKGIRDVADDATLVVTIKDLGHGNCTLVIGGKQVAGSYSSVGAKMKWAAAAQTKIKDQLGGGTLNWSGS
jgi:hypothetical protein